MAATGSWIGIEAVRAGHLEFLRAQPSGSFDCVVFDPMFDKPRKAQEAFDVVRRHADYAPLSPEALQEASGLGGQERRFAALATRELSRHQRLLDLAVKLLGGLPSGRALTRRRWPTTS